MSSNNEEKKSYNDISDNILDSITLLNTLRNISNLNPFLSTSSSSSIFSHYYDSNFNVNDEDINIIAESQIKIWTKSTTISSSLIKYYVRHWNEKSSDPTLESFSEYLISKLCMHSYSTSIQQRKELISHFIINYGRLPSCLETEIVIQYRLLHNSFPSQEEISTTFTRMSEFELDPEEFHKKDKNYVPLNNIHLLEPLVYNEENKVEDNCAICMDEFKKNSKIFKLNPCGHVFHANSEDCLKESSIINWFKEHKTCPVCRSEIIVKKDNESINKQTEMSMSKNETKS